MTNAWLEVLRGRVRSERRRALGFGLVVTLLVLLLALAPVGQHQSSVGRWIMLALLGAGAAYLVRTGLRPADADPGIRALLAGGDDVVWIYVLHVVRGVNRGMWLQLGLVSGEIARIALRQPGDEDLLARLVELAPHATTGYDPQLEQRFRSDPAALRRG